MSESIINPLDSPTKPAQEGATNEPEGTTGEKVAPEPPQRAVVHPVAVALPYCHLGEWIDYRRRGGKEWEN